MRLRDARKRAAPRMISGGEPIGFMELVVFSQIDWGILKLHAYCLGSQQQAEAFEQGDVLTKSSSISAAWSMSAVPR